MGVPLGSHDHGGDGNSNTHGGAGAAGIGSGAGDAVDAADCFENIHD